MPRSVIGNRGEEGGQITYTVGEAGRLCGTCPRTVQRWCDNGQLRSWRLPGFDGRVGPRRILADDLLAFCEKQGMVVPTEMIRADLHPAVVTYGLDGLAGDLATLLPDAEIKVAPDPFAVGSLLMAAGVRIAGLVAGGYSGLPLLDAGRTARSRRKDTPLLCLGPPEDLADMLTMAGWHLLPVNASARKVASALRGTTL